jgi:2-dehydropantoate 2-reductase
MNIAVLGAGAVGCYFGALLARAGHDVTFIGRPAHVEAINARGLILETRQGQESIRARAATDTTGLAKPDVVLVCVKSADTEDAARALVSHIGPHTRVVSLQNGVDNAERMAAILDQPVIAAVVYVGTEMAGPGHVRHHGRGELLIGASPASPALAETLIAAGIPTTVSASIASALWSKLIVNCAYPALSAIGQITYGPMMATEGTREVITATIAECRAVAQACGVAVPADITDTTLALAASMPAQTSSTAQDLARGKPSEIEFLNGHIVRQGRAHGIATPTNLALLVAVRLAEKGRPRATS